MPMTAGRIVKAVDSQGMNERSRRRLAHAQWAVRRGLTFRGRPGAAALVLAGRDVAVEERESETAGSLAVITEPAVMPAP